jgi:hypothetical protein
VLVLALVALAPTPAGAQVSAAAEARLKLLNKKAMDEYDSLEFEAAKAALLEALGVAKAANISSGATLTETYLHLGVVYGAGLNDRLNAVKYFTAALRISPEAQLNPARATPALEEMFKSAQEKIASTPPPPPPPPRGPPFQHTPVDEATTGRNVQITARVATPGVVKVVLFYRTVGSNEFRQTVMRRTTSGIYVGVIPGQFVRGRAIHYYIEAQDDVGERVDGHGTATSPNIISVQRGRVIGPVPPPPPKPTKSSKVFSIGLMAGAGFGIVNGGESEHAHPQIDGTEKAVDINPGGAMAPFHVAPELSYHLNDQWHLCLLGRIQVVNALSAGTAVPGKTATEPSSNISFLGQARAKRFFGDGAVRFYMAFGAGAGQIRHRIPLGDYDKHAGTPNDRVDARVAGIGAFGLGGGLSYMFSSYVGFALEVNGLILVPDFAANIDVNTGLVLSF